MTTGGPPPRERPPLAEKFRWGRLLVRVELDVVTKCVAWTLAHYADADGRNIRPGLDRLIAEVGVSKSTIIRKVNLLKELGLIYQVASGSRAGRRGWASEYELTIPHDLADRVRVRPETPDQVSPTTPGQADQVSRVTPGRGDHRSPVSGDLGKQVSPASYQVSPVTQPGVVGDTPPSTTKHLHQEHPSSPRGEATATAEDFEHFDEFWDLYPLKEYKSAAFSKWMLVTERTDYREIIDGLRVFDFGSKPDMYPYASAWLAAHRWRPR